MPGKDTLKLTLYACNTPNGQKASIALAETGTDYDLKVIDITKGEQHTDAFYKINPNGKIPALTLAHADGTIEPIMESGAILLYLADRAGSLIPGSGSARSQVLQWLFFQVGHVGPMFGQFGHFYVYAKNECEHPYPLNRYRKETQRLLGVMDEKLNKTPYIAGPDYSIADIATFPWVECLSKFYKADDLLELERYERVKLWQDKIRQRKAVQEGLNVLA